MVIVDLEAADLERLGRVILLRHRSDDAGVDRVGDGDRFEGGAQFIDRLGGVVLERLDSGLARIIGVEGGQRRHRHHLAGADVEHEAFAAGGRELIYRGAELGLQRRLHAAVDRQCNRRAAGGGIEQARVERLLHAERALAVDIGPAEHMGGERGLGVEALGLAGEGDRRLADRVHLRHELGRRAAAQIDEALPRFQHRNIIGDAVLGHRGGELLRHLHRIVDELLGVQAD